MSRIRIEEEASAAIPTPPASNHALFIDTADSHLKRKNSSGTVTDIEAMGSGDVVGPASATDNAITRFDLTTGKLIQNSLAILSDAGSITLPAGQKVSDSDLLDGLDGTAYLARANHTGTQAPATISPQGAGSTLDADLLDGFNSTAYAAQFGFGAASVAATTTDRFLFPGFDSSTAQTAELFLRVTRAGTLFGFYVQHASGAGNGNSIVYTVRVNGANTSITASIASTSTQASDVTNTAAVVAGDRVSIIITKAASIATSPVDIYCTIGLRAA